MKHTIYMIAGLAVGLAACQDSAWDDHYAATADTGSSLMELLDSRSDLSRFAQVVRQAGMDEVLASSQTFTVFAPDNAAMAATELEGDTLSRFLYNHICRYTYTAGDVLDADDQTLRVKMLNGKYQNLEYLGGQLVFGNDAAVQGAQGASNGVLNTVGVVVPFYSNIYEELTTGEQLDSVGKYLAAYDEYTFQPTKSTALGVNDLGETLYDSVFTYSNDWMTKYGSLNTEDSLYTVLAPSNEAWQKQYEKILPYFRTFGSGTITTTSIKATGTFEVGTAEADSLQQAHTRQAIMQDMVFRKRIDVENPDGDSIQSTALHAFHSPQYLFDGAEERDASNGVVYVTDDVQFDPTDSWHELIVVEAENTANFMAQGGGATSTKSVENFPQFSGQVSENKFFYYTNPSASSQRPTVRFKLPNTLAGKYNIYIVTLPCNAVDTTATDLRSTKLNFYLNYVHEDGTMSEDAAITTPSEFNGTQTAEAIDPDAPVFETDRYAVDTMLIARNFRFPYANYTASPFTPSTVEAVTTAYLRVYSAITTSDLQVKDDDGEYLYDKALRIDCIILEPVN